MKKYNLVKICSDENRKAIDVVKDIYNEIFNKDNSPKEVYIVMVMGKKMKKDKDNPQITINSSYVKIHVYDNYIDAVKKINKCILKNCTVWLYAVNGVQCAKLIERGMIGYSYSKSLQYDISDIGKSINPFQYAKLLEEGNVINRSKSLQYYISESNDAIISFAKCITRKSIIKIKLHF